MRSEPSILEQASAGLMLKACIESAPLRHVPSRSLIRTRQSGELGKLGESTVHLPGRWHLIKTVQKPNRELAMAKLNNLVLTQLELPCLAYRSSGPNQHCACVDPISPGCLGDLRAA